jgi:hypothetical protein
MDSFVGRSAKRVRFRQTQRDAAGTPDDGPNDQRGELGPVSIRRLSIWNGRLAMRGRL